MYNIGICDDGENICASIENMLIQCANEMNIQLDISVWYTGEGLRDYLEKGNPLDILFLDIELISGSNEPSGCLKPTMLAWTFGDCREGQQSRCSTAGVLTQMSGIEVGDYIRNQLDDMGMQIIYISGKASYAQQLFKTQPLDFLVKPISQGQIKDVLEMALRVMKKKKERFEFQQGKDHYYVPMGDIAYFVSEGRKVKIVTLKEVYEFYGRLREIVQRLPEDFMVIHKSYIVNKEYIFRYTYEMVELVNGSILTISPANRKQVRERILREG